MPPVSGVWRDDPGAPARQRGPHDPTWRSEAFSRSFAALGSSVSSALPATFPSLRRAAAERKYVYRALRRTIEV